MTFDPFAIGAAAVTVLNCVICLRISLAVSQLREEITKKQLEEREHTRAWVEPRLLNLESHLRIRG